MSLKPGMGSMASKTVELAGGGRLELDSTFLDPEEAELLFARLRAEVAWSQTSIEMFGRSVLEPRLTAWYGDPEATYAYSRRTNVPRPWTPTLAELRRRLEVRIGTPFNGVLANLYRDGRDSMGAHADAEPELGRDPVIASVSLGATRRFVLTPKQKGLGERLVFQLTSGSLLVMSGTTQAFWRHAVPKQSEVSAPRINLTFRLIQRRGGPL